MAFATWNPADKHSDITLSGGNLVAENLVSTTGRSVRADVGISSGKHYWEVSVLWDGTQQQRVGIATASWPLDRRLGIPGSTVAGQHSACKLTEDSFFATLLEVENGSSQSSTSGTFTTAGTRTIMVALDADAGKVWFGLDGTWEGGGDPGAGTGETWTVPTGVTWYPAATALKSGATNDTLTANFGASAFAHTVPSGFTAGVLGAATGAGWSQPFAYEAGPESWAQPFSLLGAASWAQPLTLGGGAAWAQPWSGQGIGTWAQPWTLIAGAQWAQPWTLIAGASWSAPFALLGGRAWAQPWRWEGGAAWAQGLAYLAAGAAAWAQPWGSLVEGGQSWSQPWRSPALTEGGAAWSQRFGYQSAAVSVLSTPPALTVAGRPVRVLGCTVSMDTGQLWTCELTLADEAGYAALPVDTAFELSIGAETWAMLVDGRGIDRAGPAPVLRVRGISAAAALDTPRATPITQTWAATVARTAAEAIAGAAIDWQLIDWPIPAARLAYADAAPLEILRRIAAAPGGVIEAEPAGTLIARHRFPAPVATWPTAGVAHTYTDANPERLTVRERHRRRRTHTRQALRDVAPATPFLAAEVDARTAGPNAGRLAFAPGDTVHTLVHAGRDVTLTQARTSAGTLRAGGALSYSVVEDVTFQGAATARLSKPAQAITASVWLGASLGSLTLAADGLTVTAAAAGLAVARLTYTVAARAYAVDTPASAGGATEYPVALAWDGEQRPGNAATGLVDIVVARGAGDVEGPEVIDPLMASLGAARSRGQAELDDAEPLQTVEQETVYRDGVRCGQLVEIIDAAQGAAYRAQIVAVRHQYNPGSPRLTTTLELLRA